MYLQGIKQGSTGEKMFEPAVGSNFTGVGSGWEGFTYDTVYDKEWKIIVVVVFVVVHSCFTPLII